MRLSLGPELVDEHDARVEIALLAGDALIDRVGDDVADAPRILRLGEELLAGELLAGIGVPQPELGLEPAVLAADAADDEGLRVQHPPIVKGRNAVRRDALLDERRLIDRCEQAGGAKVACHHVGHLARGRRVERAVADEIGDGDRQRLDLALSDVELNHRASRQDGETAQRRARARQGRHPAGSVLPRGA